MEYDEFRVISCAFWANDHLNHWFRVWVIEEYQMEHKLDYENTQRKNLPSMCEEGKGTQRAKDHTLGGTWILIIKSKLWVIDWICLWTGLVQPPTRHGIWAKVTFPLCFVFLVCKMGRMNPSYAGERIKRGNECRALSQVMVSGSINEPSLVMLCEVTVTELGGRKGGEGKWREAAGRGQHVPEILQEEMTAQSILEELKITL